MPTPDSQNLLARPHRQHRGRHLNNPVSESIISHRNSLFGYITRLAKDISAHRALRCHVEMTLGHHPDCSWRCHRADPGINGSTIFAETTTLHLLTWKWAVLCGHLVVMLLSLLTMHEWRRWFHPDIFCCLLRLYQHDRVYCILGGGQDVALVKDVVCCVACSSMKQMSSVLLKWPAIITRDSCTQYYWECILAMGILSVRLSVTTGYRIKPKWDRDSRFSPYDSLEFLVSYEVIWCHWVRRFPSNEGIKEGYPLPLRNSYFTTIGSSSVKMVADRHRLAAYHNEHCWWAFRGTNGPTSMTLNDLEPPKYGF